MAEGTSASADRTGGWISTFLGVPMIAAGLFMLLQTLQLLAHAVSAPGTVIEMKEREDSDGDMIYSPVVSFTTADWKYVRFTSLGSSSPAYRVGAPVEVLYDPRAPQAARLKSFHTLWLGPVGLLVLGSLFIGGGVAARRRADRAAEEETPPWRRA